MFAALASSPPMAAAAPPHPLPPPPPRAQISAAVYRAARNGAKRQHQMRPRANTVSCSSPRGSVAFPSTFASNFTSNSTSTRCRDSIGLNALSLSPHMGPQVVGSIGHNLSQDRRFTISGDELMSDRERRRMHRTLSLHGRDLFANVMSASEGSASSPRTSPRMSPGITHYMSSTEVTQVEEEDEEVEDDGWATVPTRNQKANKRQVKRQERLDNPTTYVDSHQQQQQGSWYDDHFQHDDAVELYYEHANTTNSRQVGSSKKSNQFKAAAKRSFAIDKRNKQRGK